MSLVQLAIQPSCQWLKTQVYVMAAVNNDWILSQMLNLSTKTTQNKNVFQQESMLSSYFNSFSSIINVWLVVSVLKLE